mmetsp:Transcript_5964/g.13250  ORF Transcript_5964/g.13250 Transcript_5964/m.13250 type:complete len:234 (-) Transcript_5964:982-1683(-)
MQRSPNRHHPSIARQRHTVARLISFIISIYISSQLHPLSHHVIIHKHTHMTCIVSHRLTIQPTVSRRTNRHCATIPRQRQTDSRSIHGRLTCNRISQHLPIITCIPLINRHIPCIHTTIHCLWCICLNCRNGQCQSIITQRNRPTCLICNIGAKYPFTHLDICAIVKSMNGDLACLHVAGGRTDCHNISITAHGYGVSSFTFNLVAQSPHIRLPYIHSCGHVACGKGHHRSIA